MIERRPIVPVEPNNQAQPYHPAESEALQLPIYSQPIVEARSLLTPRSLLAPLVEMQALPPERLKAQPKGEVVDIKKVGETIAALEKVDDHYEVAIFDGRGNMTEIIVDPTSHEVAKLAMTGKPICTRVNNNGGERVSQIATQKMNFSQSAGEQLEQAWYTKAPKAFQDEYDHKNYGFLYPRDVTEKPPMILPAGEWKMGSRRVSWGKESHDTFYFVCDGKGYALKLKPQLEKTGLILKHPDSFNPDLTDLNDSLRLRRENTLFRLEDKEGKELVSYSGMEPIVDPSDPNTLYFINTGQVYRLDLSGVQDRTSRPILERQIQIADPKELDFEPQGNFLIIRSGDQKLSIVDKETGDVIKSLDGVKGPFFVDQQGDILYIDTEGKLREVQTNFQAIPQVVLKQL